MPLAIKVSWLERLVELLRSFPRQARLVLGISGVIWATAAGIIGLLSCFASLAVVALSLHATVVEQHRNRANEILTLDQTNRLLMRTILSMSSGRLNPPAGQFPAREAWARFQESLTSICGHLDNDPPNIERLRRTCGVRIAFYEHVTPEIEAFDPPRRTINPSVVQELLMVRDDVNDMAMAAVHDAGTLVGRMIEDYGVALLVLTLSTVGFVSAGLVLILLVGRAAIQAADARNLLGEAIEALPAGVVVYDARDRLMLFNSAANSLSPGITAAGSIGKTYAEALEEMAKDREAQGLGLQENWIAEQLARFESKGDRGMRHLPDGRWVELYERSTASGYTVGLRLDVTERKNHEIELEHARDLLQETIDTLPAGVVVYDQQERLMMFNSAAVASTPILKRPGIIGITYEDLARETASLAQEFGGPPQNTPEEWIERFRSKGGIHMRQAVGGRWFEWYEKLTPSGRTVGLRVDVTDMKAHELELEHARAEYQALIDSLSDVAYALDVKGRFAFVSAAAQELLGVAAERLIGRRFVDYVVSDQVEEAIAMGRAHYQSVDDAVRQTSLQMIRADGTVRHVEARYRKPAGGVREEVVQVGVLRDVTERAALTEQLKRQVAEIERSHADYRLLVDSLGDLVLKIDGESAVIVFASVASQERFGIPPSQLIGTNSFDLIVEDDRAVKRSAIQAALKRSGGEVLQAHFRVRTAGGEERHIEARYRKARGSDGRTIVVALVRDVEEQYQLSRRLETEAARLRSIVDSSGALILLIDRETRVAMVNSEFTSITGVGAADALGRPLKEVIDCQLDAKLLGNWLSGPPDREHARPVHFTQSLVDRLGNQRICAVTVSPSLDADGNIGHIVLLGVDDTERRMAEQALFDAERLAIVGEMAATVAHEINQPLQVISIACASAEDELAAIADNVIAPSGDFLLGKVKRILQQIDRARHIVDELKAFVRGTGSEAPAPFDPADALRGAVDLTKHALRQSGVALATPAVEHLPPVVGHISKLEQVLINLVNNARDAGGKQVEISAVKLSRDGRDYVRIVVDDDGPGIAPEVLPRLFMSFVTTKPRGMGTGLGLRICRRIIEEMGGTITAANRPHGGASFEILLPAASEPDLKAAN
jgi:PAS domain S-box-containing protein